MEQAGIDRINELARLSKQRELTEEETAERDALRRRYLDDWRAGAIAALEGIRIRESDGSVHPLRPKAKAKGKGK